jgi:hypothetical protein
VSVVEICEHVVSGYVAVEVKEYHKLGKRHYKAVEKNIGEEKLEQNAKDGRRKDLNYRLFHIRCGILSVPEIANDDEDHLRDGKRVTDRVERTSLIDSVIVKVEENSGSYVDRHENEVYREYRHHR